MPQLVVDDADWATGTSAGDDVLLLISAQDSTDTIVSVDNIKVTIF